MRVTENGTVVVPIADPLRMFALVIYGPHSTGADLDAKERALLSEFSRYAAAAYGCVEVGPLRATPKCFVEGN